MIKKTYILAGVVVVVIIAIVGIYLHFQKADVSPESQELDYEAEMLSQDVNELNEMENDTALDTLDQDLSDLTGETSVDVSLIENLESELQSELDGFLNDLTDLEGFENDGSLDGLDGSLSSF